MYSSAPGTSFQFFPAGVKILTDFQGEGKIWRKKTIFVCKNTKITIFLNQEGANIPPLPPPPNDVPAPHTYLLTQCTFWHTPQYEARKTTTDRGHNNVLILQYYTIIIKNLKYIFYIPYLFFCMFNFEIYSHFVLLCVPRNHTDRGFPGLALWGCANRHSVWTGTYMCRGVHNVLDTAHLLSEPTGTPIIEYTDQMMTFQYRVLSILTILWLRYVCLYWLLYEYG